MCVSVFMHDISLVSTVVSKQSAVLRYWGREICRLPPIPHPAALKQLFRNQVFVTFNEHYFTPGLKTVYTYSKITIQSPGLCACVRCDRRCYLIRKNHISGVVISKRESKNSRILLTSSRKGSAVLCFSNLLYSNRAWRTYIIYRSRNVVFRLLQYINSW